MSSKEKLALFGGQPIIGKTRKVKRYPSNVIKAVNDYLESGKDISISGKNGVVLELENVFIDHYGQKYAIALNSGSNCIFSALFAMGIGEGDEVIAPAYGFHACISSIYHTGAKPVFCDCEENNVNMCPERFKRLITKSTKAVVVVHNWGGAADIEKICNIAHEHGLYVIEDCSHAHGSEYKGKTVGRFGDVSIFSLQANKTVYAGEGGILLTSDKEIFEKVVLLGRYRGKGYLEEVDKSGMLETGFGLKFRIHPLGAVIALQMFKNMESIIETRNRTVKIIEEKMNKSKMITPPFIPKYVSKHSYYGYKPMLNCDDDALNAIYIKALQAEGMDIHKSTYVLNPQLELFKFIQKEGQGDFRNAEKLNSKMLSLTLPNDDDFEKIAKLYGKIFDKVDNSIDEIKKYVYMKGNKK